MTYLQDVWASRYFWTHLALSDLRAQWRRSFFGILWAIIQPLGITILLTIVFARMFHQDMVSYGPYILSGIVVWQFVTACATAGALSFVQADAYIKQCRTPLLGYVLRNVLVNLSIMSLAAIGLLVWCVFFLPQNIGIHYLAIPTFFPIITLMAIPVSSALAYVTVQYRDIPHAMGLILQTFWFMSPVYFKEDMFRDGNLDVLVDYNPVYHLMQILRAPLLDGTWPTLTNYVYCLCTAAVFGVVAIVIARTHERRVIFYL